MVHRIEILRRNPTTIRMIPRMITTAPSGCGRDDPDATAVILAANYAAHHHQQALACRLICAAARRRKYDPEAMARAPSGSASCTVHPRRHPRP